MNLKASLGVGAAAGSVGPEQVPTIPELKRTRDRDEFNQMEQMLRFAWWAHQLRRFPTVTQIRDRFGVCRATAYRWRSALASAHGITAPPDSVGEEAEVAE